MAGSAHAPATRVCAHRPLATGRLCPKEAPEEDCGAKEGHAVDDARTHAHAHAHVEHDRAKTRVIAAAVRVRASPVFTRGRRSPEQRTDASPAPARGEEVRGARCARCDASLPTRALHLVLSLPASRTTGALSAEHARRPALAASRALQAVAPTVSLQRAALRLRFSSSSPAALLPRPSSLPPSLLRVSTSDDPFLLAPAA
ncbi:hypothetical protein BC628DRAFT_1356105 [Trametes gibbosa]|nr:hypothetical protein BC628DRAFT_1356105 [Trametes gibbosa]